MRSRPKLTATAAEDPAVHYTERRAAILDARITLIERLADRLRGILGPAAIGASDRRLLEEAKAESAAHRRRLSYRQKTEVVDASRGLVVALCEAVGPVQVARGMDVSEATIDAWRAGRAAVSPLWRPKLAALARRHGVPEIPGTSPTTRNP